MSPGVWKLQNVALALTLGLISQAAMPLSMARTTGFLVGDAGSLRPAAPEGADFTMAADGITIITIAWQDCFNFYGPGNFRLDMLTAPIIEDGGVSTTPDGTRMNQVTIPATFVDGCWYAEGFYRVPDEFNRGADANVPVRGVDIEARFIPQSGGPAIVTVFVDLVRPPVVFVHGLWSDSDTWAAFPTAAATVLPIREFADYGGAAASSSLASNKGVVYNHIQQALERCRRASIRCTRVDVIGHSMGGLLTRIHSNSALYATALNRYHGNVRKLITLDTPHTGSPLANLLSAIALDPSSEGAVMRALFERFKKPIHLGAIFDLSTDSAPITTLQQCPVPAHAQVGIGGPDLLGTVFLPMGGFYRALFLVSVITGTDVFGPTQHDVLVGRLSQEGGLPASATTLFGLTDGGIHISIPPFDGNTSSVAYSDRARELLDTRTSENDWGTLPAGSPFQYTPAQDGRERERALEEALARVAEADRRLEGAFDLTITSPAPGTVITPGSTITVTVSVAPGVTVDQVVVAGENQAVNDTSAPFSVSFEVPLNAFRSYEIQAFGKNNATNEYYLSVPVAFVATPAAALQSLEISPLEAFIVGPGDTLRLSVTGLFADGIRRPIPPSEVTWTSLNPSFVSVAADGIATGVAVGVATVRANSQSLQTTRTVEVLPRAPLIFVDNFETGNTSEWSLVAP